MEVQGIPPADVLDKSRKKSHYFDIDYSPYLIEDEEMGILRIPESKKLEDAVPCQDKLFLEFIRRCIELDPSKRFTASEAIQHPWIREGLKSSTEPLHTQTTLSRQREENCDGAKVNIYEESPARPIREQPKKSLSKVLNLQSVKIETIEDNESMGSTPKSEGGLKLEPEKTPRDMDTRFRIIEQESIVEEFDFRKPHNHTKSSKKDKGQNDGYIKLLGKVSVQLISNCLQYEIIREEDEKAPTTAGNQQNNDNPPVLLKEHDAINNENTINKITITVYQRRNHQAQAKKAK